MLKNLNLNISVTCTMIGILSFAVFLLNKSNQSLAQPSATRPNFIVVQVDDLSLKVLNMKIKEGSRLRPVTPIIMKEIKNGGAEFERFYSNSPICAPSRASLLSGVTTHNHGMLINAGEKGGYDVWQRSTVASDNIAISLQKEGYRTTHIGKFLNGYDQNKTVPDGWRNWITTAKSSGAPYYEYPLNINGRLTKPIGSWNNPDTSNCRVSLPGNKNYCRHSVDVFTAYAVNEIEKASVSGDPFFIALDHNAPHEDGRKNPGPEPPTRLNSLVKKVIVPPYKDQKEGLSLKPRIINNNPPMSPKMIQDTQLRLRKEAVSMRAVDQSVERIISALKKTNQFSNTYILFTSDNGFFSGEHRIHYGKYMAHEPSARQPLFIKGPGVIPGSKISALSSNIDIAPTIYELANLANGLENIDGISLKNYFKNSEHQERLVPIEGFNGRELSYPGPFTDGSGRTGPNQAIVSNYTGFVGGNWKYVYYYYGEEELYNLKNDPQEIVNLAKNPGNENILIWARGVTERIKNCQGPEECRLKINPPS